MVADRSASITIGITGWVLAVLVASGWQLATRFGVSTNLQPMDLALLRYVIPSLILAPLLLRYGFIPKTDHKWLVLIMILGAGFPFGFLSIAGAQYAPAAHMGALLPGTMPVFVAVLAAVFLKERFSLSQILGFGVIVVGLSLIVGPQLLPGSDASEGGYWRGHLLFLSAALLWAVYTVAYRKSGLDPWHMAAVICFWSSLMVIPAWYLAGPSGFETAPLADILLQVGVQGVLAGVIGLAVFALAIRHLGAGIAATSGAAVPPLTAVGGIFILAEPSPPTVLMGIALTSLGILFATGLADLIAKRVQRPASSS
ncbi:MAG: DMT family transporter [Proteobacteria bacterium]|nr:DMT family transporter [Pseudomonadota bacterium]